MKLKYLIAKRKHIYILKTTPHDIHMSHIHMLTTKIEQSPTGLRIIIPSDLNIRKINIPNLYNILWP